MIKSTLQLISKIREIQRGVCIPVHWFKVPCLLLPFKPLVPAFDNSVLHISQPLCIQSIKVSKPPWCNSDFRSRDTQNIKIGPAKIDTHKFTKEIRYIYPPFISKIFRTVYLAHIRDSPSIKVYCGTYKRIVRPQSRFVTGKPVVKPEWHLGIVKILAYKSFSQIKKCGRVCVRKESFLLWRQRLADIYLPVLPNISTVKGK